jgi:hypothetical protein
MSATRSWSRRYAVIPLLIKRHTTFRPIVDPDDVTIQLLAHLMSHERGLLFHSEVPNAVSEDAIFQHQEQFKVPKAPWHNSQASTQLGSYALIYTEFRICGWPFVRSQAAVDAPRQ